MTVPSTARRAGPFLGNGVTTTFSFSFKTFAAGDLVVTRTASNGVETTLVLNSDYSVSLNSDQDASPGGTITYPLSGSPLAAGQKLTIVGDLDYEQTTDLLGGGAFNARVIEDTFDRTVIQIQQLEERLDRALVAPVSDTPVDMTMPTAANRANRYLSFDATGKPISTTFDIDAVQNASTAAVAAAAAAAASQVAAASSQAVAQTQATFVANTVAATTPTVVNFNGDGATVAFTLPSAPGAEENTLVFIGGVYQQKSEYSVSGTTLTFTSAPPAGTNNIEVQIGPATNVAVNTSLGVSFLQAGAGAVTRTAQSKMRERVTPEDFGAVGDGVTNDQAALVAMAAYINSIGGGVIEFGAGKTYLFGGGANQTMQDPPVATYYTWPPTQAWIMEFANLTKPLVIKGNGAKLKNASGGKYGTFNTDGSVKTVVPPYLGPGASTPYYAVLYAHGCSAGGVIENLEIDGNIQGTTVGGFFSDTGIQISMDGIFLEDNLPAVNLVNVASHHHGRDGLQYDGPATSDQAVKENFVADTLRVYNNGRNNISVVGGRGGEFRNLQSFQAGKGCIGANAVAVASNPASGIDFEAEGGKKVRDWLIDESSQIYDCSNQCVVADSGDSARIDLRGFYCGTTNYSLWLNKPQITVRNALVVGTVVQIFSSAANPQQSVKFLDTIFSNETTLSPTGAVYVVNGLLIEGGVDTHSFERCVFIKADPNGTGGGGNANGPSYTDCIIISKSGDCRMSGKYFGYNRFVEDGGTVAVPGGISPGVRNDAGYSYGPWAYRVSGVTTVYGANRSTTEDRLQEQYTGFDGDITITAGTSQAQWTAVGPLTANRNWTLANGSSTATAGAGQQITITRTAASTGAFNLNVKNAGGTTLKALSTGQWATFLWNPTYGWNYIMGGSL